MKDAAQPLRCVFGLRLRKTVLLERRHFSVLATNIPSVVPVSNPIVLHHQLGIVRQPFNHQNATLETRSAI